MERKCPFTRKPCMGEECACWIQICKPVKIAEGVYDPLRKLVYEGCGLVNTVPWRLEKREQKRR